LSPLFFSFSKRLLISSFYFEHAKILFGSSFACFLLGCLGPQWDSKRETYFSDTCAEQNRESALQRFSNAPNTETKASITHQINLCYDAGGCWDWCASMCDPFLKNGTKLIGIPILEGCPAKCSFHCVCPQAKPFWDSNVGCVAS
jgi:hypothetical protein